MAEFTDLLAEYDAETQAFSAAAGPMASSPYRVKVDGRITGVRVVVSRTAATTLTNGVILRFTCTDWTPNQIQMAVAGTGLQTVPAFDAPVFDFPIDQPVVNGHDITIEGKCVDANQVTNTILVSGKFTTGGR